MDLTDCAIMGTDTKTSIRMKDCIILYIDILGTKSILSSEDEEKILLFISNMTEFYHIIFDPYVGTKIFSDNIIIFDDYSEENLEKMVDIASQTQFYLLMKYNLLSRGGIARGKLYYDDMCILGKGLVDAYYLESKVANYPRIVLSDDLTDDLPSTCKSMDDGHIMVNYMLNFNDQNSNLPVYNNVKNHHDILVKLANSSMNECDEKEQERINCKYLSIMRYHNNYCKENYLADLIIDSKEVNIDGL